MKAESPRTPSARASRLNSLVALALFSLASLWVFDFIFAGYRITNNSYLYAYEPWAHYMNPTVGFYNYMLSDDMDVMSSLFPVVEQLRRGDLPFWNGFWQLGTNGFRLDTGWFYPLRWLWIILGIEDGMTAEVLIRHTLSGYFTFLLLQLLGVGWLVSMVSGLGYAFGSVAIGDYMFGFGPLGLALPLLLYLIEKMIQMRRPRDLIFLTFGWMFINTHMMVHANALACGWLALYAVLRILGESQKPPLLRGLVMSIVCSILILAILLLPTLDYYVSYFNASYREGYSTQQLHPGSLLTLFYNSFFGVPLLEKERYLFGSFTGSGTFIGFTTMLGLCSFALPRILVLRDKYIIPPFILSLLLLPTIYEFPFEQAEHLFGLIPILKATPPYYQRPILQFFLMILGSLGLDFFVRGTCPRRLKYPLLVTSACMALLSCAAFLAYYYWKGPSTLSWDYFETATTAHAIMVVALLIYWRLRQRQANDFARQIGIFGSAFVLLVATAYEGRLNGSRWFPYSRSGNWNPRTETTDFLKAALEPGERVVSLDRFAVPGLLFSYALPVAAGRSMPQAEYLQLLRMANPSLHKDHPTQSFFDAQTTDLKSPVWELANVNFFGASLEVNREYFERRYGDTFAIHSLKDGIILERRQRTKPYRITSHVVKLDSLEEIISTLQTRGLEPSILTDDPLFPPSAAPQPCPFVTKVTNYRQTSSAIRFSVTTEANQGSCPIFVMLSMAHDKGWRAYVDGKRTEPFSGFGLFPFVPLPSSGTHEVDFVFYPRFLGLGAILSALGVILLIFSVKTGLRTKQRVNTGPAE